MDGLVVVSVGLVLVEPKGLYPTEAVVHLEIVPPILASAAARFDLGPEEVAVDSNPGPQERLAEARGQEGGQAEDEEDDLEVPEVTCHAIGRVDIARGQFPARGAVGVDLSGHEDGDKAREVSQGQEDREEEGRGQGHFVHFGWSVRVRDSGFGQVRF